MKIYLLSRLHKFVNYDEYDSFVVRAQNENKARIIASKDAGDEGPKVWMNTEETSCGEIRCVGKERIILGSFNPG